MVIVNLMNENDNIPNITCEPIELAEGSEEGVHLTTITVGTNHCYYYYMYNYRHRMMMMMMVIC